MLTHATHERDGVPDTAHDLRFDGICIVSKHQARVYEFSLHEYRKVHFKICPDAFECGELNRGLART